LVGLFISHFHAGTNTAGHPAPLSGQLSQLPRRMLPQTYLCLFVWCKACHHQGAADLQAIIDAGKGDVPLKDLRFRCAKCGSRMTDAVVMGKDVCAAVAV
jgi:hypothetical protein